MQGDSHMPKVASRISPAFFIAAIVCFFFTFAGVSCNTGAAKATIDQLASGSGGSSAQIQQANACLDALNGVNFITYSGINLALGQHPSVVSTPSQCQQSGSTAPSTGQANVGMQTPFLIALIVVAAAALFGLIGFVVRGRLPALLAAALGIAAIVLLYLGQSSTKDAILNKVTASAGSSSSSSIPGLSISSFINFNLTFFFWGAIALCAVGALLNLPAVIAGTGGKAQPTYAGGAPPTPGGGLGGAPPPPPPPG
jgi:hypothetical protein